MNALATVSPVSLAPDRAKQLRRAAQQLDRWTSEREEAIRQAHAEGASYREIALAVGLSHVGVMKIVNKGTSLEPPAIAAERPDVIEKRRREALARERRQEGQGS